MPANTREEKRNIRCVVDNIGADIALYDGACISDTTSSRSRDTDEEIDLTTRGEEDSVGEIGEFGAGTAASLDFGIRRNSGGGSI